MKVPYFSNNLIDRELIELWETTFRDVITSESLISGSSVEKFESEFAKYIGTNFAIGTSNGLDGLVLALRAANIGHGDLVAVPAHTFIATHLAIINVGAIPVSVDVDCHGLIELELLEKINEKIRAVIPVHLHGAMVDMNRLNKWAKTRSVIVIEDASQAHGCERDGVRAGSTGDMSVFSLYPTKNLGALGDAGVIVTSSKEYNEKLRSLRNYGSSEKSKYVHTQIGFNNRLDTIQAAILNINLSKLDTWNEKRRILAKKYEDKLSDLPIEFLINQRNPSVYHHFPILTLERDSLQMYLLTHGISTEIHYPNLASTEIQKLTGISYGYMHQAEKISQSTLSLPLSQWHTEEQVDYVCEVVRDFFMGVRNNE